MEEINLYGVATPYAAEIAETCKRLEIPFRAIDNLGKASDQLNKTSHRTMVVSGSIGVAP
jgi:hypothetical protein